MEFIDSTLEMRPVEMEDTLLRLLDELSEYPDEFIRRVDARVTALKFNKPNAYSVVDSEIGDFDIYVVNLKGRIYIAGSAIDSRTLITFGEFQFPAIEVCQLCLN